MSGTLRQKLGKTLLNNATATARAAPSHGAVTHFSQQSKKLNQIYSYRQRFDQQVATQT